MTATAKTWERGTVLDAQGNLLTSPSKRAHQARSRAIEQRLSQPAYRGAAQTRKFGQWGARPGSPESDLHNSRLRLLARSDDLSRNDPIASGLINTYVTEVIGSGIRVESDVDANTLGLNDVAKEALDAWIDQRWKEWIRECDVTGRANFYELMELHFRQRLIKGEAWTFPRWKARPWAQYRFCLQFVESEQVGGHMPHDRPQMGWYDGIHIDDDGTETAIYLQDRHPGDRASMGRTNGREIPRWFDGLEVYWHDYDVLRPVQLRGEPFLASVINYFANLDTYLEAEWWAKQLEALFGVFIESEHPSIRADQHLDPDSLAGERIEDIEPGTVHYLAPGEKPHSVASNRPGAGTEWFVRLALQFIGAAKGLPIEMVLKDFSKSNFSNVRAALIGARRFFRTMQLRQIHWIERVRSLFMEELFLTGRLPVRDFAPVKSALTRAQYITPGWQWVDPLKDTQAADLQIRAKLSNRKTQYGARGENWRAEVTQALEEEAYIRQERERLGLPPDAAAGTDSPETERDSDDE